MGGSLPKYEDLVVLIDILDLDQDFVNFVNYTGIKLQTVLNNNKGKNPGDFIMMEKNELIKMFKKLVE